MVGLSGFACLVYQIVWMRQVGVLSGNTTHAAALTILAGPVVVPRLYPMLGGDGGGIALQVMWTVLMVLPAAFCMGGTLPVVGQAVIHDRPGFGSTTARLYAANTVGAVAGAFVTAFFLIWLMGLRMTCLTAMAVSLVAATLGVWQSRRKCHRGEAMAMSENTQTAPRKRAVASAASAPAGISRPLIVGLACASGFNVLALEVVWTRMLAQVHENSVYSFATVLVVVLACLAIGAWLPSSPGWRRRGCSC